MTARNEARNLASGASQCAVAPLSSLLARTAAGDERAFETLHRVSAARLWQVAVQVLGRDNGADEVLQEAFLRIWLRASQYHVARGTPMTWMMRIVRNQAIDTLRRSEERLRTTEPLVEDTAANAGADPAGVVEAGDLRARVLADLQRIAEPRRGCLALVYQCGYSAAEAGRARGIPAATVRTWSRRYLAQAEARFAASRLAHA